MEDEINVEASTSNCVAAEGEEIQEDAALPSAIFDDDGRVSENRLKEYEDVVKDKAYKTIQAARGYNTSTAYCSKQVEYLLFCETVINRPLRRSGVLYINDKTRTNEEASASTSTNSSAQLRNIKASITNQGKKLSYNTCNIYVAAIVDLWNYQKLKGVNSHESPRTKVISQLLKWVRRRRGAADNRKNNIDRATSLQVSGCTTIEQVVAVARKMYNDPAQHYKHSFRNANALLVSHYSLLRGESVRCLELADILLQELPKIGADSSYPIVTMIFNRSKTNQFNTVQSGAFMRNKNVAICPFMALSSHFFWSSSTWCLARAIEEPPAELKRLVFPMADYWYERHTTKNVDQTSGSADGFLLLLKCFQTTFLQDAAAMMDVIPDHPIWKNELFTHPLFLDFRRKVRVHIDAREEPQSELLKKVAPEVQD
ncbi:hypothetical protein [Parasitella parasitica]|uniref:Ndc10 domain-containing protein n=1 Tax=Parasitella parasitica TaxID=35722 RepID=A0A0B7N3Y7_9FUNG|nr:hypothetical protein [Parasitella parasitica]